VNVHKKKKGGEHPKGFQPKKTRYATGQNSISSSRNAGKIHRRKNLQRTGMRPSHKLSYSHRNPPRPRALELRRKPKKTTTSRKATRSLKNATSDADQNRPSSKKPTVPKRLQTGGGKTRESPRKKRPTSFKQKTPFFWVPPTSLKPANRKPSRANQPNPVTKPHLRKKPYHP